MKNKNITDNKSIIELYEMVLDGTISKFPKYTWSNISENEIRALLIYFFERKLKWSNEDIKNKLNQATFIDNGLTGMLKYIFNSSPYQAINMAYPNRFEAWELNLVPRGYWTVETATDATKWLIEEKLKWSNEDIKNKLNQATFIDNGLSGMLTSMFNGSPYKSVNIVYPNRFKPRELKVTQKGYWTTETATAATKWLIEEKLKWTDDDIKNKLNQATFTDNGLGGMICSVFNNSPYQAINTAYPNRFKPWELNYVPQGYWTIETATAATKWLIEEKLKWTDEDIKNKLRTNTFIDNGLVGMLGAIFNNSPYQAINTAYPNKFKPWNLKFYPKKHRHTMTAIETLIMAEVESDMTTLEINRLLGDIY